jgi:O-antigen/teichoic acid export membrane protein
MSRTRNAITSAGFAYVQFALGIVSGVVLVPFIIRCLGERTYGLWLACGELIAYLALTDLGVFAILPWIVASADGKGNRIAIRSFLVNSLLVGAIVGCLILVGSAAAWYGLDWWLDLPSADRAALQGPFALLAVIAALAYPLRVFIALLAGLQDVVFAGSLAVVQGVLAIVLTVSVLLAGGGAYALAAAASLPLLALGFLAAWRGCRIAPDLFEGWSWPTATGVGTLLREGVGGWLSGFGYRILVASNGLIIVALGHPEWVPIYACTAKAGQILQQMCWVLPDSSLIGLAQLHGEGRIQRTRQAVGSIFDLHFVLIGSAVCGLLAFNPTFVNLWVGPQLYGGDLLNALLAVGYIVATAVQAVISPPAAVGYRRPFIGSIVLVNGAAYAALALWLGANVGLVGLPIAFVISSLAIRFVCGLQLTRRLFGLGEAEIWSNHFRPWLFRVGPALVLAGWIGPRLAAAGLWIAILVTAVGAMLYVWWIRSLWFRLPVPDQLRRRLTRFGFATAISSTVAEEPAAANGFLPNQPDTASPLEDVAMLSPPDEALAGSNGTSPTLLEECRSSLRPAPTRPTETRSNW